jgi:hypothetical protein
VAVDDAGNVFIADLGNNRVRQVSPDGTITTVPGTENLLAPRNVALDAAGTLYISEFGGHRVRRVRADAGFVSVTGSGNGGFGRWRSPTANWPILPVSPSIPQAAICCRWQSPRTQIVNGLITTVLGTGDQAPTSNQLVCRQASPSIAPGVFTWPIAAISGSSWFPPSARSSLPPGRDLALDRGHLLSRERYASAGAPPFLALQSTQATDRTV